LQETARRYAREKLTNLAEEVETTGHPPSRELLKEYAEMGFLGINVPESMGGLGLGNLEALIVLEEFAKISSAIAFPVFESSVGPVRAIEKFASPSLAQRILPAVCKGEMIMAVAMSEPHAGSALTDLSTRGEVKDDG
jgi:butyryl-CoA dehydrogenase|tara:strand:- start:823 stop:1236 length:414 start_codon:yes stop_codon:yes gene_type:complete